MSMSSRLFERAQATRHHMNERIAARREVVRRGVRGVVEVLEQRRLLSTIYSADMSTNPGWTLDTVSGVGWGWGTVAGLGGDPAAGHTGTRVVGTINASPGYYPDNVPSAFYAKTVAINCSSYTGVTLDFWRWLGVGPNDGATIGVSNNGTGWTNIFANGSSTINETSWSHQTYDISAVADRQSTVYIRWGLGPTNASVHYCGWNIDDVTVSGTLDVPPTVVSISRSGTSPTNASAVQYSVAFSEPVTGVDVSDFGLALTGTASGTVASVSGSGTSYTVTLGSISGDGTVGLNLVDNDTIVDAIGQPLGGNGAGNGSFSGQVYTVDRVAPSVTSITNVASAQTADAAVFEVVFSEPVSGVDLSDFSLALTGTATASLVQVTGMGSAYQVMVNTPAGTGTVGLYLVDNDSIADALGNPLGGTGTGNGNFTGGTAAVNHPPANDLFANAELIDATDLVNPFTDVWRVSGTNLNATKETSEPNHYSAGGKSIWYRWAAPATKTFEVNTKGSNYDTLLAVYTGTQLTNLRTIAADDESGGSHTSKVTLSAVAGTTYWIAVDGYVGASGQVTLNIRTNHAPTDITLSSQGRVNEGGHDMGTLSAADIDAGDTITYALVSGPGGDDNASFSVYGDVLWLKSVADYVTQRLYSIRVRATDLGGLSFEKSFQISVVRQVGFTLAGKWGGNVQAVAVNGNRAYINQGTDLVVLDISTPASPVETGRVAMPGTVRDIAVVETIAYVASGNSVQAVNVGGATPVVLGQYPTSVDVEDVYAVGTVAYILQPNLADLKIVSFANPAVPVLLGEYRTAGYAYDLVVVNNTAYIADGSAGLQILDVSRPDAVMRLGSVGAPISWARRVSISGTIACIADGNIGLQLVDVSSPAAPVLRGNLNISAWDVTAVGNTAYVAFGAGGVKVVNISNPAALIAQSTFDTPGLAGALVVSGSMAYVADSYGGLRVVGVSNPASPIAVGQFAEYGDVNGIWLAGSLAYVTTRPNALQILDVSNPSAPVLLGRYTGLTDPSTLSVAGNIACVVDDNGMSVLDVTNPASPSLRGFYPSQVGSFTFWGVQVVAGMAYTIESWGRLRIFDLSNPAAPTLTGMCDTTSIGSGRDIQVVGSKAYVADDQGGLVIVDVSNPAAPVTLGSYVSGTDKPARGLAVAGTTAFLACDNGGLLTVDVSNAAAPALLGSSAMSSAGDVEVAGPLVHIGGLYGYAVFDVSDVTHPLKLGQTTLYSSTGAGRLRVVGDYTFLVDSVNGLRVMRVNRLPEDVALSATVVAENWPAGTTVGSLSGTDPNLVETLSYSLVSGTGSTDNGQFTIAGDQLRTAAVFDYETKSSYSIRIRVTDSAGGWYEEPATISITNANDAPTNLGLTNSNVAENEPVGTTVGTFTTADQDAAESFTYTLVSGSGSADNAGFTISGNALKTAASFDFEARNSYAIRVRTTDSGGLWYEEAFTVTVTNVNETATNISLSSSSIAENQPVGMAVGALSSTDPDVGDTFTYTLVSGTGSTDNALFAMSGSTLQTASSFDYEAKSSYSIRVRTTDQGGLFYEKSFTVTVTDVDDTAPTVTAVYVRGSAWAAGYLSFLAGNLAGSSATYGYAIPVGSGAMQLQTLPWRTLNRISMRFSEDVSVAQAQFAIVGSVGSYSVSGFSYNATDHVATWSLSAYMGPDKLYVAVPGSGSSPVRDAAGNVLDGEWSNPGSFGQVGSTDTFPSGNGSAGGDFAFRFDVLPGDSTGGSLGKVNVGDIAQTKTRSSLPVSTSTYRSDFDGNNLLNVADIAYVKTKSNVYSLPVNPPVLPVFGASMSALTLSARINPLVAPVFGAAFSQVSLLLGKRGLY